jgi:hypothetical protein
LCIVCCVTAGSHIFDVCHIILNDNNTVQCS